MTEIYITQGRTNNYMGVPVSTDFYSVVHNGKLVIRTSDKKLAYSIRDRLIGPAVNTQDDLQAIHTTDKTKTQRS